MGIVPIGHMGAVGYTMNVKPLEKCLKKLRAIIVIITIANIIMFDRLTLLSANTACRTTTAAHISILQENSNQTLFCSPRSVGLFLVHLPMTGSFRKPLH